MIKLFVFDLGGVIIPFEHRQIAVKLLKRSREKVIPSPHEVFSFLFDMEKGFVNRYEEGLMSSVEFFSEIRDRYALDINFEEFKAIWNPIFRSDPEVNEAIQHLKRKDYPLFLLSNTNELHFAHIIKNYPVVHLFDEWILSYEVGAKKPKKRIYDQIFERMDVKPDEVFYVDDIREYVEAARGYGIQGLVFEGAPGLWDTLKSNGI